MGRFSKHDAEAQGWVIVQDDEESGPVRAEKQYNGRLLNEEAHSMGLLLERISSFEAHIEGLPESQARDIEVPVLNQDEAGLPIRTVIAPDGSAMSEEEWAQRDRVDAIYKDGEMIYLGGSDVALEAQADKYEREEEAASEASATDAGDHDQIEVLNRDHQLKDLLVVREGEESDSDAMDRKLEETEIAEAERTAAGRGIGPDHNDDFGGPPSEVVIENPTGADSPGAEAAEAEAQSQGKEADTPEGAAAVAEAGAEAEQVAYDEPAEGELDGEASESDDDGPADVELQPGESIEVEAAPEATPAAAELAEKHEVDLSQVKGSGSGGKITKPDVENALPSEEDGEN